MSDAIYMIQTRYKKARIGKIFTTKRLTISQVVKMLPEGKIKEAILRLKQILDAEGKKLEYPKSEGAVFTVEDCPGNIIVTRISLDTWANTKI